MTEKTTLLAHLASKNYITRVEDAATDALAFILTESPACLGALNDLLKDGGFDLEPIDRVETQVTDEDGSRPDMIGYDRNGGKRLVVEVKFWAALGQEQASGYFNRLDKDSPGGLLFIVPESRYESLWGEIKRQMDKVGKELEPVETSEGDRRVARVVGSDKRLMLVGWDRLLRLIADAGRGDPEIASDIRQLRGLTRWQDDEIFQPIRKEELAPSRARMIRSINGLIDNVIESGREKLEITIEGYKATPQREGYGRYFGFIGVEGYFFLGVNLRLWETKGYIPWLWIEKTVPVDVEKLRREFPLTQQRKDGTYDVPIDLKTDEEYQAVLDDVVSQISKIKNAISQRS